MQQVVNLCSPSWDPYRSYGKKACRLAFHLTQMGVYVNAFTHDGGDPCNDNQPDSVRAIVSQPVRPVVGGIVLGYPSRYYRYGPLVQAGPRVAVTAWESTQPPGDWIEPLNECGAVSVGSQFTRSVLVQAGVSVPVHVHPLGVDSAFKYINRLPGRKPFTFLMIGDRGLRKGWDIAVKAFRMAFGDSPDHRLIIKTFAPLGYDIKHSNVQVLTADFTQEQMIDLYARVDAFVSPNRGEGFGWPPREAAATGLPVIATDWGGTADDLRAWGYPLRITGLETAWRDTDVLLGCGEWAVPDVDHLVKQMQYVASGNPAIRHMAQHSARRVRRLYPWRRFAENVWQTWLRVSTPPVTDRRRRLKAKA